MVEGGLSGQSHDYCVCTVCESGSNTGTTAEVSRTQVEETLTVYYFCQTQGGRRETVWTLTYVGFS